MNVSIIVRMETAEELKDICHAIERARPTTRVVAYRSHYKLPVRDPKSIYRAVERATGLTEDEVLGRNKSRYRANVRWITAMLLFTIGITERSVALHMRRDRTTISYYIKNWRDKLEYDEEFRTLASKISNEAGLYAFVFAGVGDFKLTPCFEPKPMETEL